MGEESCIFCKKENNTNILMPALPICDNCITSENIDTRLKVLEACNRAAVNIMVKNALEINWDEDFDWGENVPSNGSPHDINEILFPGLKSY